MKCPNCEKDLVSVKNDGLKLDVCPFCKGIWFDAWEWEDLAKVTNINVEEFNELIVSDGISEFNQKLKQCPICNRKMEKIKAYGLILDRCLADGGIWFDGLELSKALDIIAEKADIDKQLLEKYVNKIYSEK